MNHPSVSSLSLGDVLLGILAYRWLVLSVAGLVFVAGGLHSGLQEPEYEHSSTLQIGLILEHREIALGDADGDAFRIGGGRLVPVESVTDVQEKLERGYIPAALADMEDRHGDDHTRIPDVRVHRPTGSGLLVLDSRGTTEEADMIRELHRHIMERVREDHAPVLHAERQRLKRALADRRADLERAKALSALLDEDADETGRERAARLEYEHLAARSEAAMDEYRARLEAVRETRAPVLAHAARSPVQPPLPIMLGLWLMVGLVLGLLAAGMAATLRGAAERARVS